MDEQTNEVTQTPARRERRKRTKFQIFKEAYLPALIVLIAVVLVITFIVGSVSRVNAAKKAAEEASLAAAESLQNLAAQRQAEAQDLIARAEVLAAGLDYQAAIDLLDTFSGESEGFPNLVAKRAEYVQAMNDLVVYSDPNSVPNLSFQMLIADPARAFSDEEYGEAYNRNYVTTDEFSKILQQLYDNGYMLVGLHDLVTTTVNEEGKTVYIPANLYMPSGKKPIVLTQTAANYYTYMTDGDGDGLPDASGDGFPYRLNVDGNGKFVSEMIDADGNTVVGNYDFVTILEDFIARNPDFSYQGARAVLAVTGYDGIFGYRTDPDTEDAQGGEYYTEQVSGAQKIVKALQSAGYELASYTYENVSYGEIDFSVFETDLNDWNEEVAPLLGNADILVYPNGDDLEYGFDDPYEGDRYNLLYESGFRFFIGMDYDVPSQAQVAEDYVRQVRKLVTGSWMAYNAEVFDGLFDAASVLSADRGNVPE